LDHFPEGLWEEVTFLGNVNMEHDVEISSKEGIYGAFILEKLMKRLKETKNALQVDTLLLALTLDPVVLVYHRLVVDGFKRIINLVKDFVSEKVGMVSLFEINEETGIKVAAHGLGHNLGLSHHLEPVDLMYIGLLNGSKLEKDGFCSSCNKKLNRLIN
jgi:hypothetical protein